MGGEGHRRKCPTCGQDVTHIDDTLSHRELNGPRNITSSNIDRMFDDNGRILFIEEKNMLEQMPNGQKRALKALSNQVDVWVVIGSPDALIIYEIDKGDISDGIEGNWDYYQNAVYNWFNKGDNKP